jgi:hypothetical protein
MKQVFSYFAVNLLQQFLLFIPLVITFTLYFCKTLFKVLIKTRAKTRVKTLVINLVTTLVKMSKNNAPSISLPQSNT